MVFICGQLNIGETIKWLDKIERFSVDFEVFLVLLFT